MTVLLLAILVKTPRHLKVARAVDSLRAVLQA